MKNINYHKLYHLTIFLLIFILLKQNYLIIIIHLITNKETKINKHLKIEEREISTVLFTETNTTTQTGKCV